MELVGFAPALGAQVVVQFTAGEFSYTSAPLYILRQQLPAAPPAT